MFKKTPVGKRQGFFCLGKVLYLTMSEADNPDTLAGLIRKDITTEDMDQLLQEEISQTTQKWQELKDLIPKQDSKDERLQKAEQMVGIETVRKYTEDLVNRLHPNDPNAETAKETFRTVQDNIANKTIEYIKEHKDMAAEKPLVDIIKEAYPDLGKLPPEMQTSESNIHKQEIPLTAKDKVFKEIVSFQMGRLANPTFNPREALKQMDEQKAS